MKTILWVLAVAVAAGLAGWRLGRGSHGQEHAVAPAKGGERRVLFYQSAMHPWIKSDRPGSCTICGMALTPVYEGDTGIAVEAGVVSLASNAMSVLHVRSEDVVRGTLVRTLRVAGVVNDDDSRRRVLSATVAGRLEAVFVPAVGTEVVAGQPLARLYSPMLLEAERQYAALARGVGAGGTDAAGLRDAAALRLRQLGLTEAQIAQLPGKEAADWLSEIVSPISGTVVERFVYGGQYVMEGEKLFEIADLSTLWFKFDAYEQDLPWLRVGQDVEVHSPALPGRALHAPIRFIDPTLSEMTRSAKVRVELTNSVVVEDGVTNRLLRHRMYAEGRVRVEARDVVLVPRSAVLSPSARAVVYLDRGGGAYEQREVRLGRFGDGAYEVLAGLAPGERVVVNGNLMIDAQAQLNQVISGVDSESQSALATEAAPTQEALPRPGDAAAASLKGYLEGVDALRGALASDDLAAYRVRLGALEARARELRSGLDKEPAWAGLAVRLGLDAPASPADLREARRDFHRLNAGALELAKAARRALTEFASLKVYQCPMTAEAFDGAPSRAQWFQFAPPLRNPWFGAAMLDCGSEVKP
ncbi:MAG: efflux RND transporter periplasmic adaptor subunit [Verrucomicrobiales bacterium]|nr:efflux RND transporter periplasmic adaptor subunit [Verrucomicrobiales bacterium]